MSGQPYRYSTDPTKFRQEYLDTLALQAGNNDMNYQANKTYNATNQLPAISQMPDTRSTTDILADVEKMKLSLVGDLKPLMDSSAALSVVQRIQRSPLNADGSLLVFFTQRAPELVKGLQKMYKFGIKGDANDIEEMVLYIEKSYKDGKMTSGSFKSIFDRPSGGPMAMGTVNDTDIDGLMRELTRVFHKVPQSLIGNTGPEALMAEELLPQIMGSLRALRETMSTALYKEITTTTQSILEQDPTYFSNEGGITADYKNIQDIVSRLPRADTVNALIVQLEKSLKNSNPTMTVNILQEIAGLLPTPQDIGLLHESTQKITSPTEFGRLITVPIDRGDYPNNPAGERQYKAAILARHRDNEEIRKVDKNDARTAKYLAIEQDKQDIIDAQLSEQARVRQVKQDTMDALINRRNILDAQVREIENYIHNGRTPAGRAMTVQQRAVYKVDLENAKNALGESENAIARETATPISIGLLNEQRNLRALYEHNVATGEDSGPLSTEVNRVREALRAIEADRNSLIAQFQTRRAEGTLTPAIEQLLRDRVAVLQASRIGNEDLLAILEPQLQPYLNTINAEVYQNKRFPGPGGEGLKRRRGRPKGSGIAHPFVDKVDKSRGISPAKRYISFGKYLINTKKLDDSIIAIKRPSGANIVEFPSNRVSRNLSKVVKTIIGGGQPSYTDINDLTEDEKAYLYKISRKAEIADKIAIPTPSRDQMDKDINQFEIMKGELMSGNDSKELVHKFKTLLLKLSKNGSLPKNQVNEIMSDLLQMGY